MGSRAVWRLSLGAAVVLLVLLQSTQSVRIQYQGFQVQLESVKKLSDLERQFAPSPRLQAQSLLPAVCHHPALPSDLQPVCTSQEAASIFKALKMMANDECELCVNIACTGCL
ncbi:PREDICTED: guanylate cyclase activator 2B [Propithecus coquereli]|uniref:Guanylate cyclase activator 2B n=1 Tax=Propithecus coquereli TaxID=379532 RepID=A0A2K6G6C9_PROCO|nr:PREDICTED: guanylate cyclase activator 2B [Propithecus coquereli]